MYVFALEFGDTPQRATLYEFVNSVFLGVLNKSRRHTLRPGPSVGIVGADHSSRIRSRFVIIRGARILRLPMVIRGFQRCEVGNIIVDSAEVAPTQRKSNIRDRSYCEFPAGGSGEGRHSEVLVIVGSGPVAHLRIHILLCARLQNDYEEALSCMPCACCLFCKLR